MKRSATSTKNTLEMEDHNYEFFTQDGCRFTSKRIGYFALCIALFWLFMAIGILIGGIESGNIFGGKNWYWVFGLIAFCIQIRIFAQQVTIDCAAGTLSKSYFGLFKKEIAISQIKKIEILRHLAIALHNGTDIIVITKENKSTKILERIGKSKNVEPILGEIKQILQRCHLEAQFA